MSNSSLPNLTEIVTKECDTSSMQSRLPSMGDDVPTAYIPKTNDSYGGMSEVCAPNSVNLFDDCVLWCELPPKFMERFKASGGEHIDIYFFEQLEETGMNMSQVRILRAVETQSAAPLTGRPPSILGLGTLALAACIAFSL